MQVVLCSTSVTGTSSNDHTMLLVEGGWVTSGPGMEIKGGRAGHGLAVGRN